MLEPYWTDGDVALHCGDALQIARQIPAGTVRTIVTSPPYYGLRDYGTAGWTGGDPECAHDAAVVPGAPPSGRSTLRGNGHIGGGPKQAAGAGRGRTLNTCPVCGAVRQDDQIGAEETLAEYVANLVALFRELRRTLTDDGTAWINLGDSYAANGNSVRSQTAGNLTLGGIRDSPRVRIHRTPGYEPKNLLGVPWRVAFGLQDDGWILRSEVIWAKPNPMPESVTDRPTRSHEHLFLLAKSPRYYYDADAIREPDSGRASGNGFIRPARIPAGLADGSAEQWTPGPGRNRRDVWTITPAAFPGAHFAVYPPELVRPCILAGSAPGDTVLDPFSGSGTTGEVAAYEGRRYVGIDLNPEYLDLSIRARFAQPTLGIEAVS